MDLFLTMWSSILAALAPVAGLDVRWLFVGFLACLPMVGMATATSTFAKSAQGFYTAIVSIAWDSSYPTGGETIDLSAIFPNRVICGTRAGGTVDDEGFLPIFIAAAAYATATPVIQCYYDTDPAAGGGANTEFVEVTNTDDLSAATAQVWMFWGD